MVAIGMGMLWGSYTLMFWGWTLIKGYSIGIEQIVIPGKYTGSWPPAALGAVTANSSSSSSSGTSLSSTDLLNSSGDTSNPENTPGTAQPSTNVNGGTAGQTGPIAPEGSGAG